MQGFFYGAMAEWFIAAVSKTDDVHASVGSNPTGSAIRTISCHASPLSGEPQAQHYSIRGHVSHESQMGIHSEYGFQNGYMRFALTHVSHGLVAQLVEQGTENPRVSGSTPLWTTIMSG